MRDVRYLSYCVVQMTASQTFYCCLSDQRLPLKMKLDYYLGYWNCESWRVCYNMSWMNEIEAADNKHYWLRANDEKMVDCRALRLYKMYLRGSIFNDQKLLKTFYLFVIRYTEKVNIFLKF